MGEEGGGFHTSTTLNASRAKDEKTREKAQKQQEKAKKCCFLIGCWFYAPGLNVSRSNIDRINYYVTFVKLIPSRIFQNCSFGCKTFPAKVFARYIIFEKIGSLEQGQNDLDGMVPKIS